MSLALVESTKDGLALTKVRRVPNKTTPDVERRIVDEYVAAGGRRIVPDLAKRYGLSKTTVYNILNRQGVLSGGTPTPQPVPLRTVRDGRDLIQARGMTDLIPEEVWKHVAGQLADRILAELAECRERVNSLERVNEELTTELRRYRGTTTP